MNKNDLNEYVKRWTLVRRIEDEEWKNAPVALMVQQMLAVWEIAQRLNLKELFAPEDHTWQTLQKKWLDARA